MNFNEYQEEAAKTNLYSGANAKLNIGLEICSEAGEIAGILKRIYRDYDNELTIDTTERLKYEIGDVIWGLAMLASEIGVDFEEIAQMNLLKLKDRQARNAIKGQGDKR